MIDRNGKLIHVGDRVDVGSAEKGTVVFSLDTDEFAADFPRVDWEHFGPGMMIRMDGGALVFLDNPDEHTEVIG